MNRQTAGLLLFGPISVTVHPKRSRGDVLQVSLLEGPFPTHPLSPNLCTCCFRISQNLAHNPTTHSSIITLLAKTSSGDTFH